MSAEEIFARILPYQKTAAALAAENDVPLQGEKVRETDTGREKTGDGETHYNDLPYNDDPQRAVHGATATGAAILTGDAAAGRDALQAPSITEMADRIAAAMTPSAVTYAGGMPATETVPLSSGGNLVKTYHYDAAGNPVSCDWNFPEGPDYVETFTYDGAGNATGSTFAEA